MPSPRKRRLKRAAGVVLGKGNKITKAQGADKQFIRSLVSLNGAKSRRAGAPFVHGQKPADGDFKVLSGLVKSTVELDMQATCSLALAILEADDAVTLEDAEGTVVKILAKAPAEGAADGDEILDENDKSLSPRTFLLEVTGVAADDATALAAIINGLDIKIDAKADDAAVHLAQEMTGSVGNKAITVPAGGGITMAANVTGFGGGCSAKDALHYFAEDAPKGADPFLGTLTSSHGVLWLENPRHGLNGLIDLSGADDNVAIDPGINDGVEGALVSGQAADRLHYKIIMKGGAIAAAATIDSAAGVVNGEHPGFATAAADAVAAANDAGEVVIGMMQKVIAGNTSLAIVPAAPAAGGDEKDEDFLPSPDSGMIVHWFLERIAGE